MAQRFNQNQQQQQNNKPLAKYARGMKKNNSMVIAVVNLHGIETVTNSLPRPFAELTIETPQGNRYNVRAYGRLAIPLREIQPGQSFEYTGRWKYPTATEEGNFLELKRFNAPVSKEISPYYLELQKLAKEVQEETEMEEATRPDSKKWEFGEE